MESKLERVRLILSRFTPESLELLFRRIEQPRLLRFDDAKENLLALMRERVTDAKHRLALQVSALENGNPRTILARGYSMVRTADGAILRDAAEAPAGTVLEITPARGRLTARVQETNSEKL